MLRVAGLWRYPVKSLLGEPLDASEVGPTGLVGDRAFGIVDGATGRVLTARREPRLLFASACWHDGEVEIVRSDGEHLETDAALSAWLGRAVRLTRAGPEGGVYEARRLREQDRLGVMAGPRSRVARQRPHPRLPGLPQHAGIVGAAMLPSQRSP